jgi:hypothetical protein
MRIPRTGTLLALAFGLSLAACNRTEPVAPTSEAVSPEPPQIPQDAAFAKEAYALKSNGKDPAEIAAALRELRARYGYPALRREMSSSQAVPAAVPGALASGALGKAAATTVWTQAREVNIIYYFAHSQVVSVPANATLQATGIQVDATSDPMIMGFYKSVGTDNPEAYRVKFVGFNDDWAPGSLSSRFVWTNNTGAAKSIRIVSWCYPDAYGQTTMNYKVTLSGTTLASYTHTMWVNGNTQFETDRPSSGTAGCTGPTGSNVELKRDPHSPTGFGSTLVAFDEGTMEGSFIRDTDFALRMSRPLLQSGHNFLMGYFEGDGYQPSPMDESDATIDKLDAHYHFPFYFAWQVDRYNCP